MCNKTVARVAAGALLGCMALPVAAGVVVMKNGDRITGDVKRIWDGEVYIEPAYADEFSVDQSEVDWIEDDRPFEIEYADGRDVIARLGGKGADGEQVVIVGGREIAVPLAQLAELEEPDEYFDWSSHLDINSTVNKGNTDSEDIKISGDFMFKRGRQRHFIDVLFSNEEQNGVTTKDRDLYQYNFSYDVGDPWFFGALGSYESDPIKQLDYRYNLVPGFGYYIWDDANALFSLQLGAGYQAEKTAALDDGGAVTAFVLRFRYEFSDPDLTLYADNTTSRSFYGRENTVTQFSTGMRYEITDLLYANMQFDVDYESEPVEGAENEDVALLFGIGVEFEN